MPLTKKDVQLFCRSYKRFSKLLILCPMVHPATIHGLLVEFNFDYGFVMQLILKLESQRNTLYWDEVARASQIMEQQNRARMNFNSDANNTNQLLTQMMDNQMCRTIDSYGEPSNNNLPLSPLMEVEEHQTNENSSHLKNNDAHVAELMKNQANIPVKQKTADMKLNEIMQTSQQVDGVVKKNNTPAPTNTIGPVYEAMQVAKQPRSQTYSDPKKTASFSVCKVNVENQPNSLPSTSKNNNLLISELGNIPKVQVLQTISNPNIINTTNNQAIYLQPAQNYNWRIHELMEAARRQSIQFHINSNNINLHMPGIVGNHNNMEQALNRQMVRPHLYSINRIMRTQSIEANSSSSSSNINGQNSGNGEVENRDIKKKINPVLSNELHITGTVGNRKGQKSYVNPASNNITLGMNKLREIRKLPRAQPQQHTGVMTLKTSSKKTKWKIIKVTNVPKILTETTQYQNNSGLVKEITLAPNDTSCKVMEIPETENTNPNLSTSTPKNTELMANDMSQPNKLNPESNDTNWQISEIMEHPKIQMVLSRSDSCMNLSNNEKIETEASNVNPTSTTVTSNKRVRKQKLKIMKSTSEGNNEPQFSGIKETQIRKPIKRRMKGNNSDVSNKKLRTENQLMKPISTPINKKLDKNELKETPKLRSKLNKTNEMIGIQERQQIQEVDIGDSKENLKFKTAKTRSSLKKTPLKRKEKLEIIEKEAKPEMIDLHVKKTKKTPKNQNRSNAKSKKSTEMIENQKIKSNVLENKKYKTRKYQPKGNNSNLQIKKTITNGYKPFSSGTDFFRVDPNVTKIEYTSEGQVITVCPTLFKENSNGEYSDSDTVQFIRRYPKTKHETKRHYLRSNKTDTQTPKIKKKVKKTVTESVLCETNEKSEHPKTKLRPKRQAAKSSTETKDTQAQNTMVIPKKQKGKTTKGRAGSNKNEDKNEVLNSPTGKNNGRKVPKGSVLCCCQSIGFRKKYKLPPFDKDDADELYPDEHLFPKEDSKPKNDEPFDPNRETLFEYFERNPNADREIKKFFMEKNKKSTPKKTSVKRLYNTRSNKGKKMKKDVKKN